MLPLKPSLPLVGQGPFFFIFIKWCKAAIVTICHHPHGSFTFARLAPGGDGRWTYRSPSARWKDPTGGPPGDVDDFLESLSGKIWVGHSNLGQSEAQNQQFKHGSKSQQGRKVEHLVSISEISCPKKILAFAILPELSQFMSSVTGGVIQRATTRYQQTWHNNQSVFEVSGSFSVQGCAVPPVMFVGLCYPRPA